MFNTFDITLSGYPYHEVEYPNGDWHFLHMEDDGISEYWHAYKSPKTKTVNLLNIESFHSIICPVVKFKWIDRNMSWWKKFWFAVLEDNDKIWKLDIKVLGQKEATVVKMRSGDKFIIDESAECLKNAIDSSVWTAITKDELE